MTGVREDVLARVVEEDRHILVIGGPGSGKTTLALEKAVRRTSRLDAGQEILFLSFSRAAIARLTQGARIAMTDEELVRVSMQTFHSFCWSILRSHAYLLGTPRCLQVLLPADEKALSAAAKPGDDTWESWVTDRERIFYEVGNVGFDLFVPKVVELFSRAPKLLEMVADKFPLVIVDEAQDTGRHPWSLTRLLATKVQVLCLADNEQQIFDYLEGVGPERITEIKRTLSPVVVDLGTQNHRSSGTEILQFGNDVLFGSVRSGSYRGVTSRKYHPKKQLEAIRSSLGMLYEMITKGTGSKPASIGILAATGAGVGRISAALNAGDNPIKHKVLFDETGVVLASRFVAFLLEPKVIEHPERDVAEGLSIMAAWSRAKGTTIGIENADKWAAWSQQLTQSTKPRGNLVPALHELVAKAAREQWTGIPQKDWLRARDMIRDSGHGSVSALAPKLDYLVSYNRGKRISTQLLAAWMQYGGYVGARQVVMDAIAQESIVGDVDNDTSGIHVLTIHRCKGKQFDGVIILEESERTQEGWTSSLLWRDDPQPYPRSRRILRVGITRARQHVLILRSAMTECPILR